MTNVEPQGTQALSPLKRALLALERSEARIQRYEQERREPIALIGLGCRLPGGATDPESLWSVLAEGVDAISEVPRSRWDLDAFYDPDPEVPGKMYTRFGGFVDDVDRFDAPFFGIAPSEARSMDPQHRLLLKVAWEALEDAGRAPDGLAGSRTGAFVGLMANDYGIHQVRGGDFGKIDPHWGTGTDLSFAAGRLSYFFGIHGPSMVVDTACSSSLLGVHLACRSLRDRECDLALVAGVNLILAPERAIYGCKVKAMAPDGRCKTFDARADGYVRGEGCVVVVLARLSDALACGDRILALIRGSAVNQDGRGAGLTAPNGLAQEAVIRQALANAGVAPESISYVEAHGTGTVLGDPIELEALRNVLGKPCDGAPPCLVGSIKTNMGHTEAVSGLAGLAKVALAFERGSIPPHLHFRELNPHISLADTRLEIACSLRSWPRRAAAPRLAGVSAFSFSGTNVHLIVEEPPEGAPTTAGRRCQLLLLSANTASSLDRMSSRLAHHLRSHPDLELADVAHTLHAGRKALAHRRAFVCCDLQDAVTVLETKDPARLLRSVGAPRDRLVTFLFPGLGDHYSGAARGLYETEPVFRQCIDECCELLTSVLGRDLRRALFPTDQVPPPSDSTGSAGLDLRHLLGRSSAATGPSDSPLERTEVAQPALFVIEYSLARLWMEWGVRARALMGHSLGEYVAACIAGVFRPEDALRLVARRAQLIERLPPGRMLAIALPEVELTALLSPPVCLAAVNAPGLCVASGPDEAIDRLARVLTERGVAHRPVSSSHAFHSAMMRPIADELRDLVASVERRPPEIPYVSNLTGAWITAEQATDPSYWAEHLCAPVRFGRGVVELERTAERLYLEVGPGQSLGAFVLQCPAADSSRRRDVVPSIRNAHHRQDDSAFLLTALAKLWLAGVKLDAVAYFARERRQRLRLPTYSFDEERYWVDEARFPIGAAPAAPSAEKHPDLESWFHVPVWRQSPSPRARGRRERRRTWLLLLDERGLGSAMREQLCAAGDEVITVRIGGSFERSSDSEWVIDATSASHYQALVAELRALQRYPDAVVHLWSRDASSSSEARVAQYERRPELGFSSLLALLQAILREGGARPLDLIAVSHNSHSVLGEEGDNPGGATLLGPCRVIPAEAPNIRCRCVDVAREESHGALRERVVADLITEIDIEPTEALVAHRRGRRWVMSFDHFPISEVDSTPRGLRERGVYLITGGLGGVGLALAERLARRVRARLVLVGRTGLPQRSQWAEYLASHGGDDTSSRRIRAVQRLEEIGAEVLVAVADVADRSQMEHVLGESRARFGAVHGVIHAAGVGGGGMAVLKDPTEAERVLAPKVFGTLVLDELLRDQPLDFFALCSSLFSVVGAAGQVDYCAANAFCDAYANSARYPGRHTVSINWGAWQWDAWQEAMLAAAPEMLERFREFRERFGISAEEGGEALERILTEATSQILVTPQELDFVRAQAAGLSAGSWLEEGTRPGERVARPELANPYAAPRDEVEARIAEIWAETLGIETVGIHDDFLELGGHSLLATQVIARIWKEFQVEIALPSIFEQPTVARLAEAVRQHDAHDAKGYAPISRVDQELRQPLVDLARELGDLSDAQVEALLGETLAGGAAGR